MKLFTTQQIAALDKFTIENEPIPDIDLMERAALQVTKWLIWKFSCQTKFILFAGPGNNGGDALAVARQLTSDGYICEVKLLDLGKGLKGSALINWNRIVEHNKVKFSKIASINDFPEIGENDVIIDGMFGSGLTRPLKALPAEIVKKINALKNMVIAIDIPSGLMGEDNSENRPETILHADFTLTFQFPKISFMLADNEKFVGNWQVLPIGLHPEGMDKTATDFYFVEKGSVGKMFPERTTFQHKGNFGHALLIAGGFGKMGAAVLASKACLRSGVGLLTSHVPRLGYPIIQTAVPEAMASVDRHDSMFTEFPKLKAFSAIGIGPGLGTKPDSSRALLALIEQSEVPVVIDADAINILSENKEWLPKLPENSILTPHPGEFERLAGASKNSYKNIQKQVRFSGKYKVILVLKGAFTSVSTPAGTVYFNSSGNPGMATAGSGDVLTGIILGLLAQGLAPEDAAIAAVYLHGVAGDISAGQKSQQSVIAGDIIENLGDAFLSLKTHSTE